MSNKYTFDDFIYEFKEALQSLWQKLWGNDLPSMKEVFTDVKKNSYKEYNEYNKLKTGIEAKRMFICFMGLLILSVIATSIVIGAKTYNKAGSLVSLLTYNETFACLNTNMCLYLGAEMKFPYSQKPHTIKLKNGDIFIYHDLFLDANNSGVSRRAEIYRTKKNRFYEIITDELEFRKGENKENTNEVISLIENKDGNILILDSKYPIKIYDVENDVFQDTGINYFVKDIRVGKDLKSRYNYLTTFNDKILMIDNDSLNLYTLDINTLDFDKFAKWSEKPKYSPLLSDIKNFSNGKIIIPIRKIYTEKNIKELQSEWDHIEILDLKTNTFISSYDVDAVKGNLFCIEKPNGDILFINKNSNYIFNNEQNEFVLADEKESARITRNLQTMAYTVRRYLRTDLDEPVQDKTRFVKLDNDKYLITCPDSFYDKAYGFKPNYDTLCSSVIYYDYSKSLVAVGERIIDLYPYSTFQQTENNKVFMIGGYKPIVIDKKTNQPSKLEKRLDNIQIIKYK